MSKLRHTGRWRQILGYALALGFCVAGLVVSAAGIRFGLSKNDFEDVAAAAFIGGMLLLIGIILVFAVRKAARRRAALDKDMLTGVTMAHMLNMDDSGSAE